MNKNESKPGCLQLSDSSYSLLDLAPWSIDCLLTAAVMLLCCYVWRDGKHMEVESTRFFGKVVQANKERNSFPTKTKGSFHIK